VYKCDYPKCPHDEPFRKDHLREHYREYHMEDLVKRGPKQDTAEPEDWWKSRNIKFNWWRCCRCLQKTKTGDSWKCTKCHQKCEPERQVARKKVPVIKEETSTLTGYSEPAGGYISGCGMCDNTWILDEQNDQWLPCICQQDSELELEDESKIHPRSEYTDSPGTYNVQCGACRSWIPRENNALCRCRAYRYQDEVDIKEEKGQVALHNRAQWGHESDVQLRYEYETNLDISYNEEEKFGYDIMDEE
jgi:hypothetical protein